MEFNHFHKSFYLDSVPPFPNRMVHEPPRLRNKETSIADEMSFDTPKEEKAYLTNQNPDDLEAPLYLPHLTQWVPQWSLKKKIAKTYGPHYVNYITMPPMKLPDENDFDKMLEKIIREKEWKKNSLKKVLK